MTPLYPPREPLLNRLGQFTLRSFYILLIIAGLAFSVLSLIHHLNH